VPELAAERRRCGGQLPFVILLTTVVSSVETSVLAGFLNAVVAKPITPERLQPTIERLIEGVRGQSPA
jgi:CheY-like chemotaxis protein